MLIRKPDSIANGPTVAYPSPLKTNSSTWDGAVAGRHSVVFPANAVETGVPSILSSRQPVPDTVTSHDRRGRLSSQFQASCRAASPTSLIELLSSSAVTSSVADVTVSLSRQIGIAACGIDRRTSLHEPAFSVKCATEIVCDDAILHHRAARGRRKNAIVEFALYRVAGAEQAVIRLAARRQRTGVGRCGKCAIVEAYVVRRIVVRCF